MAAPGVFRWPIASRPATLPQMGHKKNRKRQRRAERWDDQGYREPLIPTPLTDFGPTSMVPHPPPSLKLCGGCREFVEDQEGGRGTCLHPGSGVLSPWTDTEACAFFDPIRASRMAQRR